MSDEYIVLLLTSPNFSYNWYVTGSRTRFGISVLKSPILGSRMHVKLERFLHLLSDASVKASDTQKYEHFRSCQDWRDLVPSGGKIHVTFGI